MTDINFDDLDSILDSAGAEVAEKFVPQEEEQQENIPYLKFTQPNSGKGFPGIKNIPNGAIAIKTGVKDGKWQGYFFMSDEIRFFPVDYLYQYVGTNGKNKPQHIGGRSMMPYDENTGGNMQGDNLQPLCRSFDGKAPQERYIGAKIRFPTGHPKRGQLHVIGARNVVENKDGTINLEVITDPTKICEECPFAQFHRTSGEKSVKPLCASRWSAVIYLPPQVAYVPTDSAKKPLNEVEYPGGLAILQGNPNSVQMAMEGRLAKESGAPNDNISELPDYWRFTKSRDNVKVVVKTAALRPHQTHYVVGTDGDESLLEVPGFYWAKNSTPEFVGWDAAAPELRYLTMRILQNNWQNSSNTPQWNLHEDAVRREDYSRFLLEKKRYNDESIRERLLNPKNIEQVQQKLLSAAQTPMFLPKNAGGDDIIEGDVQELHDM